MGGVNESVSGGREGGETFFRGRGTGGMGGVNESVSGGREGGETFFRGRGTGGIGFGGRRGTDGSFSCRGGTEGCGKEIGGKTTAAFFAPNSAAFSFSSFVSQKTVPSLVFILVSFPHLIAA